MDSILASGFDGARLKVERAYRHIDEFKSVVDYIRSNDANRLAHRQERDGSFTLRLSDLGERGQQLPLIIGDAIHNLRAPLDHIWMALWRASGKTGFGTFPFHKTRENLEDAIAKSPVKVAFPYVERLILDEVKPYADAGGNEVLWTVTKFDKIDKHNLIIPTLTVHSVTNLIVQTGGARMQFTNCSFAGVGSLVSSGNPVEYQKHGEIALDVTFPENNLLRGKSVLPTLLDMHKSVSETVELFRKTFL